MKINYVTIHLVFILKCGSFRFILENYCKNYGKVRSITILKIVVSVQRAFKTVDSNDKNSRNPNLNTHSSGKWRKEILSFICLFIYLFYKSTCVKIVELHLYKNSSRLEKN